jgi:hypothetical protein
MREYDDDDKRLDQGTKPARTVTWNWKFPDGMTLGELRAFVAQCGALPNSPEDDAKVYVRIKFGGQVKDIRVTSLAKED